jgi:hypothetical protein
MQTLIDSLNWKYNVQIDRAYIITIKDNDVSEMMAKRCLDSCNRIGQRAEMFQAFDGTQKFHNEIIVPEHAKDKTWLSWVKVLNLTLSKAEICCFLSHFSLWCKCIEQDQPLIVLEHDAVMLKRFDEHPAINSIVYLGSCEMVASNLCFPFIPPQAQLCHNYRHILRTHAYSIDPQIAKNLVAKAIERGIYTAVDVFMNINRFSVTSFGIFAQDISGKTTIPSPDILNNVHRKV